jgi:hypothetical protein
VENVVKGHKRESRRNIYMSLRVDQIKILVDWRMVVW